MSITQADVDALVKLAPPVRDRFLRDFPGFGVRVKATTGAASYFITYRTKSGRSRRFTLGACAAMSLKEARKLARHHLTAVANGEDPADDKAEERKALTVAQIAKYYLTTYAKARRLAPAFVVASKAHIDNLIIPKFGTRAVKDISRDDLRRFQAGLEQTPTRANRVLALLSRLFTLAIEQGARTDNPCARLPRFTEQHRERFLSIPELDRLMDVLAKESDQLQADGVRLLILTGARIGEIRQAKWSDFDLDNGLWTKPPSNTKQRRVHRVPLSDGARLILERMHKARSSEYLFPAITDPKKPRLDFRAFWQDVRTKAALGDETRLYDVRHTYASQLLVNGVPLGVLSKLLGHSNLATTSRYAHVADDAQRAATDVMGKIIREL